MSLHEKMPCAHCGHPRHAHAKRNLKGGAIADEHCKRQHCDCPKYVEPELPEKSS